MSITSQDTTQYANQIATPPVNLKTNELQGRVRIAYFSHTQDGAGDANSLIDLIKLPAGKIRVLKTQSQIVCSALGAGRTLDIGHTGYDQPDGTAVSASIDTILDGGDVSGAAKLDLGAGSNALGTDPSVEYESKTGIVVQAKVLGDTIPDAATIKGFILYVKD